jgi:hypothetical protein
VIGTRTLLTAIIDVHVNPNTDATHVVDTGSPGSLALVDDVGNSYGPFAAERGGVAVNNGQAEATILWVALVDHIELPPGHYWVHDSDPSSLLSNAQTFNVGATLAKGVDAKAYEKYMDALIAANEPEQVESSASDNSTGSTDAGGKEPAKVTYSNPQPVVNNPPSSALVSFPANYPSFPCGFVTDKPMMVTKIMDYHINDGKGASPAMIGLQEHDGAWYGSWHAYGQAYGGIPNAIWVVTPNFEIPAGSYQVRDQEGSTLSADANSRAMCVVNLAPTITSPIDNVTGKYTIDFLGDDGISINYPLVVAIIDHKKNLEIGVIIEGQPLKFNATVTKRAKDTVKANFGAGFSDISFSVPMTFTKKAESYTLTGVVNVLGDQGGAIGFSGSRTSTDLPGYVPLPAAGLGKLGHIPGPGSAGQAAAGIAFPALATLLAAAAANAGGGRGGHYSGAEGGDGGDSGADSSGEGGDAGTDSGGAVAGDAGDGADYNGGGSNSAAPDSGDGSPVTGEAGGGGAHDTIGPVLTQPFAPEPPPLPAPGPLDGQRMTVFDQSAGMDRTYVYNSGTGKWINPLTDGEYNPTWQDFTAKQNAGTANEAITRAGTDATALADGPTKWLAKSQEDANARLKLLGEIQRTQRAVYDTPGAQGEGPISSSDRMNDLAQGLASGAVSLADAQALLNRQRQFDNDIHVGKAGTQAAADLAASQDTYGAALAHMGNVAVQGAYNAVTDVEGKTWAGVGVRFAAGALTGGASEAIYVPANIAIKTMEHMDAGDSWGTAAGKAFLYEGATQAVMAATLHCGGAALKGTASALGIKPSITLPNSLGNSLDSAATTLNTNVRELLPGAAGKAANSLEGTVSGAEARAVENLAAHNAEFRAANEDIIGKLNKLNDDALKGPLTPDQIKPTLADGQAKRTLQAVGKDPVKQAYNDALDTQISKPALDYTKQALTEKYGTITDPAHPGYKYTKMLDEGYTVETSTFRTPKPGENVSVNADNDVAGFLVKRNPDGKIISQVDLPAHDVMTAHSEGFSQQCQVYNAETRSFNATKASSELGIDFNDPKALTNGMTSAEKAKFGLNDDLSNMTPEIKTQVQLDRYARAYGNEVPGTSGVDFARDFSRSDNVIRPAKPTPPGELPQEIPESPYKAMQISGKGDLLDPQGLAFMERNKVTTNWTEGSVRSQMEAMESLRKMGNAANEVSAGYSAAGLPPLPENMQAALKIAADRSISPALRAQQMAGLGVGDPSTFADKLSAYIESAKLAPGK